METNDKMILSISNEHDNLLKLNLYDFTLFINKSMIVRGVIATFFI